MRCPCCGSDMGELEPKQVLSPSEAVIMRTLSQRPGVEVPIERIASALYSEHSDGGPDHSYSIIRVLVYRIRRKLGPVIENTYGGYRLCEK